MENVNAAEIESAEQASELMQAALKNGEKKLAAGLARLAVDLKNDEKAREKGDVKEYFGDGSEWELVSADRGEVTIRSLDNGFERIESMMDWNDDDLFAPVR